MWKSIHSLLTGLLVVAALSFAQEAAPKDPEASDSKVRAGQSTVLMEKIVYSSAGLQEPQLSVSSRAPWQDKDILVLDVTYEGSRVGLVRLHFFGQDPSHPQCTAAFSVLPNIPARLVLPLKTLAMREIKLPRTPFTLRNGMRGSSLPVSELTRVALDLKGDTQPQKLTITSCHLTDAMPQFPEHSTPLVDELGQWMDREWPGKTRDLAQLQANLAAEVQDANTMRFPAGWSDSGASSNHQFRASGFFRIERANGRNWLVDPQGAAFLSVGLDVVVPSARGPIQPGTGGLYAAQPLEDYGQANLARALGSEWRDAWIKLTRGRMKKWGFNTVGNWSDPDFCRRSGLPYVIQMPKFPTTAKCLYRDFPDVFDPEFARSAATCAESLRATKDDPMVVGYFLINEPHWGFGLRNLAARMLETFPGSHSRQKLAAWLRSKYANDIECLNRVWGIELNTFTDLVEQCFVGLDRRSHGADGDLDEFSRLLIREYVAVASDATKRVDPNHLNLGLRYAYISHPSMLAGGELLDVFSINAYAMTPPLADIAKISKTTNRPIMIGEFHFGALDRGLLSPGLRGVKTQADRGRAYRHYVETAFAHPAVVGVHYFQLTDQPFLGRSDGESYQIGLVDVCSRPYADFTDIVSAANASVYEVASGLVPPSNLVPDEIPNALIETTKLKVDEDTASQ